MELLHQLMLLQDLSGDVFCIGIVAVITVEAECDKGCIIHRGVRNNDPEESGCRIADMSAYLTAFDCFFFQNINHWERILIALCDLFSSPLFLCFLIFDQIGVCPARSLRGRDIESCKILSAYFKRNAGKCCQIAVTGRIDIHLCLYLHVTPLGKEDQEIDVPLIFHLHGN